MSLVDGFIEVRENGEARHSRLLHWLFRIVGLATFGGAMWIILWIDNRPSQASAFTNRCCDSAHCACSRIAHEKPLNQR